MTTISPKIDNLVESVHPLCPNNAGECYTGKLIGWLEDDEIGQVAACLRIPRNGLWWYPDEEIDPENGFDDKWLIVSTNEAHRPLNRLLAGAWVKATALHNRRSNGFNIEQLPARRVQMVWHMRDRPKDFNRFRDSPYLCWIRPFFPNDPDLQVWSDMTFYSRQDTGAYQGHPSEYGWKMMSLCTCGIDGCDSIYVDLQPAGDDEWIEWRDVHGGHCEGNVLGPWIQVPSYAQIVQMPPLESDL